ncbi:MAG: hypothetical protein P4M07_04550 [Xanthobacteraceae bacterium]|nr:hypothetical protein [Xanthobacteraceae bacterium]
MQTTKSPDRWELAEAKADRIGLAVSWAVLWVAVILAGIWFFSAPSFEKCSALGTRAERVACFENLRAEQLKKSPARGGSPPAPGDSG